MKKLIFIILFVLTLISCKNKNEYDKNDSKRIHQIEWHFSTSIYIIEVDGHEYLCNYHGGIIHLESCPCKNK